MLDPKIGLLENLPIFKGLSRKQLSHVVDVSTKAFFGVGENLIVRDTPADTAFLIMTGNARCIDFTPALTCGTEIGPGTLIGELAMLVKTIHSLTVQAEERIRAMAIHREALRRVMEREPSIAQQIAENLLFRLQNFGSELRRFDLLLASVADIGAGAGPHPLAPPAAPWTAWFPAQPVLRKRS